MSLAPHPKRCQERVHSGSGAEIDHPLPGLRPAPIEGIAYARKCFAGVFGKLIKRRRRVPEADCVGSSGMEVVFSGWIFRDLAVFLAHLFAERFQVDQLKYLGHRLLLGDCLRALVPNQGLVPATTM